LREKASIMRKLNDAHARVYDAIASLPFYREHLDQVLTELGPEEGKLYLDLGCGTGNLLAAAGKIGALFIGVDFSEEMLKRARSKGKNLVMADLHHLPFKDGCIDGAVSVNVFYQLPHPEAFVKEVLRILKPRGKIVVSTPRQGASTRRLDLELIKTAIRNPKLLIDIRKLVEYSNVDKKIIDANPDAFYDKEELEKIFENFEVQSIKKAYKGQNWLVVARKSPQLVGDG
jgi:ubiquinone/menaquinone biosynthesis C-methylase UbiE